MPDKYINVFLLCAQAQIQAEIEDAFEHIKNSSTNEEIAHNRGVLEGLRLARNIIENLNRN